MWTRQDNIERLARPLEKYRRMGEKRGDVEEGMRRGGGQQHAVARIQDPGGRCGGVARVLEAIHIRRPAWIQPSRRYRLRGAGRIVLSAGGVVGHRPCVADGHPGALLDDCDDCHRLAPNVPTFPRRWAHREGSSTHAPDTATTSSISCDRIRVGNPSVAFRRLVTTRGLQSRNRQPLHRRCLSAP